MKERIIGFDLARAYAIFGMYLVNFNIVFGNYQDQSLPAQFLALFSGNSSTVFVLLAGMGVALMSNRLHEYSLEDKIRLKSILTKRSWFLFGIGLVLYLWWPADILHFYGGYMHLAALLLFVEKKYYLYAGGSAILIFHLLLLLIPYETGWNFETLQYKDFWTVNGFIRNTVYNGWNPIFPWFAYFALGMYLGRLDWTLSSTQRKMFLIGLSLYLSISGLKLLVSHLPVSEDVIFYFHADYLPPFLPFVVSTMGFGMALIAALMYLSRFVRNSRMGQDLAKTGQMTLTHYISHVTLGMLLLAFLTDRTYSSQMTEQTPLHPLMIFGFASAYFLFSIFFSKLWMRKFKYGPFEILMRKISG